MAGNKVGGAKARDKNLAKDPDYYRKLGQKGGRAGNTGGFADGKVGRERARYWGKHGGAKSRRVWTQQERETHGSLMQEVSRRRKSVSA